MLVREHTAKGHEALAADNNTLAARTHSACLWFRKNTAHMATAGCSTISNKANGASGSM